MRSIRIMALLGLMALVGSLLLATPAQAAPLFKAPFACGQKWTYSHHSAEVREALDFIRSDGGTTNNSPVLASAAGTATRHYQANGAGNYIKIDHGGGWQTYYFHLNAYSVASGTYVSQGRQIGTTGNTGNSSGAHIHYEQLLNGVGQKIKINGTSLAYPGSYGSSHLTSDNGCGTGTGTYWVDTFANATGYAQANTNDAQGVLNAGTNYVYCKVWGQQVGGANGTYNHWWLKTDLDTTYAGKNGRGAYVSAYYLSRWGNDEARDNNGTVIPNC